MKTLKLILWSYRKGEISLKEMIEMINEFGEYLQYRSCVGGSILRAKIKEKIVEVVSI